MLGSRSCQSLRGSHADGLYFFRAESQQSGNVADFIELRIVFHIKGFDVPTHDPGQDGLADVYDFLCSSATDGAETNQVCIDMAATGAFHGVPLKVVADEKGLHLSQFQ